MSGHFHLDNLSTIDQKTKDIVHGYIRIQQKSLLSHLRKKLKKSRNTQNQSSCIIPFIINQICLLYYHLRNAWDTDFHSIDIKFNHHLQTICNSKGPGPDCGEWQTAFDIQQCIIRDSSTAHSYSYYWKIKLILATNIINTVRIIIGVVEKSCWETLKNERSVPHMQMYSLFGSNPKFCEKGEMMKNVINDRFEKVDDIIEVQLNCKLRTVSYVINGTDYGVVFTLKPGIYRFAVSTCQGRTVQFV